MALVAVYISLWLLTSQTVHRCVGGNPRVIPASRFWFPVACQWRRLLFLASGSLEWELDGILTICSNCMWGITEEHILGNHRMSEACSPEPMCSYLHLKAIQVGSKRLSTSELSMCIFCMCSLRTWRVFRPSTWPSCVQLSLDYRRIVLQPHCCIM